jgi:hypothetical protein
LLRDGAEILHLIEPDKRVDLRQLLAQLSRESLRHTAAHDQLLTGTAGEAALLMRIEDRFDRLFLRRVNEGAGVHHQHVGFLSIRGNLHAVLHHAAEHDLGVDEVLGAAEADHADLRSAVAGRQRSIRRVARTGDESRRGRFRGGIIQGQHRRLRRRRPCRFS